METLVATVLIVIVFMVASMVLNSLFSNGQIHKHTYLVQERFHELEYRYKHNALLLPYVEDLEDWEIRVGKAYTNERTDIVLEAVHQKTKKVVTHTFTDEH